MRALVLLAWLGMALLVTACGRTDGATCAGDADCGAGLRCVDSGLRCLTTPCPAWVCARPCDAAACGVGCRCADTATRDGQRVQSCLCATTLQ